MNEANASAAVPSQRLVSLDAYRGFVMFLMLAEVLRLGAMSRAFPESEIWRFLAWHQSHVEWIGCTLHDLIQPSFSFIVGVAVPFSIASRLSRGSSTGWLMFHALWRSLLLIFLGIFLRSTGRPITNFTFEDTLTQIGLGYFFLVLIGMAPRWVAWASLAVILVGYWGAFAATPIVEDVTSEQRGVSPEFFEKHGLTGFQAHWNKNANFAHDADVWFLNKFPRQEPFKYNGGGYQTLSFIPTLGTMIMGLLAGSYLQGQRPTAKRMLGLAIAGAICLAVGMALGDFDIVPIVKRIWTPSWVLFSGGWCLLLLAAFYGAIDVTGWKALAFPLVVIGMNSIVAYCMDHLTAGFFRDALIRHFGRSPFQVLGAAYEPLLVGGTLLLIWWLILFWLYRNRFFVRI